MPNGVVYLILILIAIVVKQKIIIKCLVLNTNVVSTKNYIKVCRLRLLTCKSLD